MEGGLPGRGLPGGAWRSAGGWRRLMSPRTADAVTRRNYELIQADSVVSGLIIATMTFVPVFFVRSGASAFEVGLITTLPAVGGLLLAMPFGRLLERTTRLTRWWARSRLLTNAAYGALALVVAVVAPTFVIPVALAVIALSTLPQTLTQVVFPLVMDGVAGPRGRFDLLGRRWAIMGLATAVLTGLAGVMLDALPMPVNYQLLFLAGGLSGVASWWLCGRIVVGSRGGERATAPSVIVAAGTVTARASDEAERPAAAAPPPAPPAPPTADVAAAPPPAPPPAARAPRGPFLGFVLRKGLYSASLRLIGPLLPLFYVRTLGASDAWIGSLAMIASLATVVGYTWWRRVARRLGGRTVLLASLLVATVAPAFVVATRSLELVTLVTIVGAFFGAGADLALFDELLARIPRDRVATASGVDSTATNLAGIVAPLLGAALAAIVGVELAIVAGAGIGLAGFALFARTGPARTAPAPAAT